MFCGLSPQGNHVHASTSVNLMSTHTTQPTTGPITALASGAAIPPSRDAEDRFTHLCCSVGCHWQTAPWPMWVLQGALPTLGGRELLRVSSTQPLNAIINTTYSFSQPRQRLVERCTQAGPSHLQPLHKYFFFFLGATNLLLCFQKDSALRINLN